MMFYNRSRTFYLTVLIISVVSLMLLAAGAQHLTKSGDTPERIAARTNLIAVDSNGQPTKQAFVNEISEQSAAKQYPYFKPDPNVVLKIEKFQSDWYILTLDYESADSSTTLALLKFDKPDTLKLYAGPGGYFHQDWLIEDGVPADIATILTSRNEEEDV